MKYQSVIEARGFVQFPEFIAERVYMREFYKDKGLPDDLCRWQDTVDAMLDGVDTDGPIYIMIDEGIVQPGMTHRRKGLHIDGYWNPGLRAHGTGHRPSPGGHRPVDRHGYIRDVHSPRRHFSGPTSWGEADFKEPEAIILASSLSAARGYVGEFEGPIGEGGDCDLIDLSGLAIVPMYADRVYACNVTGLHRSMPVSVECKRQLVRLNVPGWTV
ncbi:hypothetical protein F67_I3_11_012 [Rhizobium phage RHph_I3_11]|nr:hypothetical protein F67_I3_11_012 [Rhizobium phage RHph_I3_11]